MVALPRGGGGSGGSARGGDTSKSALPLQLPLRSTTRRNVVEVPHRVRQEQNTVAPVRGKRSCRTTRTSCRRLLHLGPASLPVDAVPLVWPEVPLLPGRVELEMPQLAAQASEAIDASTLRFLTVTSLRQREEEEMEERATLKKTTVAEEAKRRWRRGWIGIFRRSAAESSRRSPTSSRRGSGGSRRVTNPPLPRPLVERGRGRRGGGGPGSLGGAGPAAPHDASSILSSPRPRFLEPLVSGSLLFGVFSFPGSTVHESVVGGFWDFFTLSTWWWTRILRSFLICVRLKTWTLHEPFAAGSSFLVSGSPEEYSMGDDFRNSYLIQRLWLGFSVDTCTCVSLWRLFRPRFHVHLISDRNSGFTGRWLLEDVCSTSRFVVDVL